MKHKNHFASGVRIANFSDINLPGNLSSPDCLDFSISDLNRMDNISIVKKIRELTSSFQINKLEQLIRG